MHWRIQNFRLGNTVNSLPFPLFLCPYCPLKRRHGLGSTRPSSGFSCILDYVKSKFAHCFVNFCSSHVTVNELFTMYGQVVDVMVSANFVILCYKAGPNLYLKRYLHCIENLVKKKFTSQRGTAVRSFLIGSATVDRSRRTKTKYRENTSWQAWVAASRSQS